MQKFNFKIPEIIIQLADKGVWPSTSLSLSDQDLNPITKEEFVKRIASDERYICFSPISEFYLLSLEFEVNDIMREFGAPDQIDPTKCVIIGDFGIGSDSYIVLDYSENEQIPCVKRLVWPDKGENNYWEKIADNINVFLEKLKLNQINAT